MVGLTEFQSWTTGSEEKFIDSNESIIFVSNDAAQSHSMMPTRNPLKGSKKKRS